MPTQRYPFTEWLPDQPSVVNTLQDISNVIPATVGYLPFPMAISYSNEASESLNNVFALRIGGTDTIFTGSNSKLYKLNSTNLDLEDKSRTGGYSGTSRWQFVQYGDTALATNNSARIQSWNGSNFQDLGSYISATYTRTGTTVTVTTATAHGYTTGNSFLFYFKSGGALDGTYTITVTGSTTFTLTTVASGTISTSNVDIYSSYAPIAKYITIVRDFVVAASINSITNKLQWSDLNDETKWTSGAASQSDFQIISDGGDINGITGGEFGLIFLNKAIVRMSYIGSPYFFQFDTISRGLGCVEGNSIAQYGGISYFLSDDGFYACDGHAITPIGLDKVDKTFYKDVDLNKLDTMSTAIDPVRKIVVWNYTNNSGGKTMLIYNWLIKKWSKITNIYQVNTTTYSGVDYISSVATTGISLEGVAALYPNLDTVPTSLDDRLWSGGKFLFAGTLGTKIITFTGNNADANIIIGDIEQGYNSVMTLIRAQIQDGSVSVQTSSRRQLDDNVSFGSTVSASSEGRCSVRSAGRYHRVNIIPTGNWTNMISADIDFTTQGDR